MIFLNIFINTTDKKLAQILLVGMGPIELAFNVKQKCTQFWLFINVSIIKKKFFLSINKKNV